MIGLADLSWVVAGAGIALAGLTLVLRRRPSLALQVLLDLLLAAGLLRLSVDASWQAIAVTGVVVAVRHLVTRGLTLTAGSVFRPPLVRAPSC